MQVLSPAPIQAPISLLEKMPGILEQLLHDTSLEILQWKPAAGTLVDTGSAGPSCCKRTNLQQACLAES